MPTGFNCPLSFARITRKFSYSGDLLLMAEITLPETTIAWENQWLEDVFPFGIAYFQGLVSERVPTKKEEALVTDQIN